MRIFEHLLLYSFTAVYEAALVLASTYTATMFELLMVKGNVFLVLN